MPLIKSRLGYNCAVVARVPNTTARDQCMTKLKKEVIVPKALKLSRLRLTPPPQISRNLLYLVSLIVQMNNLVPYRKRFVSYRKRKQSPWLVNTSEFISGGHLFCLLSFFLSNKPINIRYFKVGLRLRPDNFHISFRLENSNWFLSNEIDSSVIRGTR